MKLIFEKQWLHALLLLILLAPLPAVIRLDSVRAGTLWGIETTTWLVLSIAIAVAHQVYVWICWRTQLHARLITRILGAGAFPVYAFGFFVLFVSRITVVFLLAASNRDTIQIATGALKPLALILSLPMLYLFYSVQRYFGFKRATGQDHFDESFRSEPLVRKGIFKFTRNGMYHFGLLIFWVAALWYASAAALFAAWFNYLYIWVHYHATELPDMRRIYGDRAG